MQYLTIIPCNRPFLIFHDICHNAHYHEFYAPNSGQRTIGFVGAIYCYYCQKNYFLAICYQKNFSPDNLLIFQGKTMRMSNPASGQCKSAMDCVHEWKEWDGVFVWVLSAWLSSCDVGVFDVFREAMASQLFVRNKVLTVATFYRNFSNTPQSIPTMQFTNSNLTIGKLYGFYVNQHKNRIPLFCNILELESCNHKHRLWNDGVDRLISNPSAITIEWVTVVLALQVV